MKIPHKPYHLSGIGVTLYFFFSVSFVLQTFASPPMLHYCRHDQRDALLEFKHEFPVNESNSGLSLSSWNKTSDCCSWKGITCDAKSGEVISLDLSFIHLNNSLKPNSGLFKLHHLRDLTLSHCHLYGEIPYSFANLTELSHLDISDNLFTSTLPHDMSKFHKLEYFDVSENSLSGPFPTSLFMIPSLSDVDLRRNQFKGPIEFRNISSSNLGRLDLEYNNFTGPIPSSISKLVNLLFLDLSNNELTGPFPRSISDSLYLDYLFLSNNKLEGEIPTSFGRVLTLLVSHNSFTGFQKSFQGSDMDGDIQTLDFSSNSLRGPLPSWIRKLKPGMRINLDLSNNSFTGSIPNTIVGLSALNLQNNNLSGILHPYLFANAPELESVDVSSNQLEGTLPKSLINCSLLEFLNVESNRIKDKFPSWLSSLPSLNVLSLRSNRFYGPLYHHNVSIGFQSLKIIDISDNDFNGTLPPFYFSKWREMTMLEEASEEYMAYMADTYFNRISMEMVNKGVDTNFERIRKDFRAIDFSGNKFHGKIPSSIGLLKELRLLNLSGNAFTSNIPQSLANLKTLEALDLSRNQLSGQIPSGLGNISFLSVMNFSHNNLEGPIPRGTQFLRQNCSVFLGNPRLYGLEDVCAETHHVSNPTIQESQDLSEPEEQVISWIAAAVAYGPGVFCGLVIAHIFSSHKHKWFM